MNKNFDAAFELFVGHRIDEIFRDKELSKYVIGMIAEIELRLSEINAELDENEKKQVLEAMQDLFFKYNNEMFKNIYMNAFFDGLYLDKKSNKR